MNRVSQWLSRPNRIIAFIYGFLAASIVLPLLRPGYLLVLDMGWTPHLRAPISVDNTYVFYTFMHFLNLIVPSQVLQKALLFFILAVAGTGIHRLVLGVTKASMPAAYFSGILYVINPFVYSRFLTGQYLVLFGYALMPWFVSSLWAFLQDPKFKSGLQLTMWALAISIVSIHSIFFLALIAGFTVVMCAIMQRRSLPWKRILKWGSLALLTWLVASSYWLVPTILGTSQQAHLVNKFDSRYTQAFQTATDTRFGPVFNAAAMYGFWVDRENAYVLPKDHVVIWPVLAAVIMALAFIGLIAARRKPLAWSLALVGAISLVLGVGVAYGPFAGIFNWCSHYIPLFKGYREPQKFIGLLILAYAFLGAIGLDWLMGYLRNLFNGQTGELLGGFVLPLALLGLPFFYTPNMLWGFGGQLRPVQYPADWYAVNQQLDADKAKFSVLFLPWHQYTSFSFTHGIIANPAQNFFDKPIIQGNNLELGAIYSQESTPQSVIVEHNFLQQSASLTKGGEVLAGLNIKYVILAKNFDASSYAWLSHQTDLSLIKDSQTLQLYLNEAWKP